MMGRQSRQTAMIFVDIESLIPETHLLRKIERMVSFNFIYDLLAPYYPATGRPSVDPVSMFKMLLIGYLYGIKSERRLVEEVQLNIAYRWFCGFELDDTIPNHSTFSKTRTRKWQQSSLFQKAFYEIVKQCIDSGLIDGEAMAADGSYIPANVSRESWINVETEVEQSMQSYLDSLDEELSNQPGFKKPPKKIVRKCRTTSQTDPDSGYINHGSKRGIGYLMEATVDCKHGILTGVDVYSANEKESVLILQHLERQINLGIPMSRLALDRGYETGAVHRGLELLGIIGYIPAIQFSNPPEKYGFSYDPRLDAFICPEGVPLTYHKLNCSKSTGKYLRCYQVEGDACMRCPKRPGCFDKAGIRRRVLASSCYPAFFRGHQRVGTPEYLAMMRLRKIWAEGSFSVLKREHCISRIRKRGILAATEECLLAAMALNLKRMVNAIFRYPQIYCSAGTTVGFSRIFAFVNRSVIVHYPLFCSLCGSRRTNAVCVWMCASCSQKRKKRLRLFRYPRTVFGVYFLTSISIKYSLIAALIFMSFPPLVCRNQRGMYITAQLMYFATEKKSVQKTRRFNENQILFRRKSSINPAASYARRSARPRCPPAYPGAWSCCGHRPRWSW